jgi:hypothetical protein
MRAPASPNGQATNRDAVNADRPMYPDATPAPATYSSPTTPAGTGCSQESSTNNAAPGTGEPIGATPVSAARGALIAAQIVISVGP